MLPPGLLGSQDNDPYPYDPDKAKQMLAEAGYPNGLTLKLLYRNASEGSSKTFATVQQDLTKVGVKVEGVPSPNADFYTKYLQEPDVAQRGVWDIASLSWGSDWAGNAALVVLQAAAVRAAVVPADRQQLRLLRQPRRPTT